MNTLYIDFFFSNKVVPEIPLSETDPDVGVRQKRPSITKTSKSDDDNIIEYEFSNRQLIQNRMLKVNHNDNKVLRQELIQSVKLLENSCMDYRYPNKDVILASNRVIPVTGGATNVMQKIKVVGMKPHKFV